MKLIYDLAVRLADHPEDVSASQALTLDESRPNIGLKGAYGLFASDEWWANLTSGMIPTTCYDGIISSLQFEGMHNEGRAFSLRLNNGVEYTYSCVANHAAERSAYQIGRKARITTYTEPMKSGSLFEFVWKVEIDCE